MTTITLNQVLDWINALQEIYAENKIFLTDLDSAIGDADHGVNMDRGFTAVREELRQHAPNDIAEALKTVAMGLIRSVGGAAGPLYGTFFLKASGVLKDKAVLHADDLVALFQAGLEGVVQRGKAVVQDKTMVDTLTPVLAALQAAHAAGADVPEMLQRAVVAAEAGMQSTIPLQARKGRASYLGERSIGHQDPGATSSYLMVKKAAEIWGAAAQ